MAQTTEINSRKNKNRSIKSKEIEFVILRNFKERPG